MVLEVYLMEMMVEASLMENVGGDGDVVDGVSGGSCFQRLREHFQAGHYALACFTLTVLFSPHGSAQREEYFLNFPSSR